MSSLRTGRTRRSGRRTHRAWSGWRRCGYMDSGFLRWRSQPEQSSDNQSGDGDWHEVLPHAEAFALRTAKIVDAFLPTRKTTLFDLDQPAAAGGSVSSFAGFTFEPGKIFNALGARSWFSSLVLPTRGLKLPPPLWVQTTKRSRGSLSREWRGQYHSHGERAAVGQLRMPHRPKATDEHITVDNRGRRTMYTIGMPGYDFRE